MPLSQKCPKTSSFRSSETPFTSLTFSDSHFTFLRLKFRSLCCLPDLLANVGTTRSSFSANSFSPLGPFARFEAYHGGRREVSCPFLTVGPNPFPFFFPDFSPPDPSPLIFMTGSPRPPRNGGYCLFTVCRRHVMFFFGNKTSAGLPRFFLSLLSFSKILVPSLFCFPSPLAPYLPSKVVGSVSLTPTHPLLASCFSLTI